MDIDITAMLVRWGRWKREYILGLGQKGEGIEYQIQRGEVLGSGNKRGGRKEDSKNQVFFKEDPEAEEIDRLIKLLRLQHREEMEVIRQVYLEQRSVRSMSRQMKINRKKIIWWLNRGKDLLTSHYRMARIQQGSSL